MTEEILQKELLFNSEALQKELLFSSKTMQNIENIKKKLSLQEYMINKYQKNLKKIPQMAKQKKQQNKQRIPPIKQIPHKKI